MTTVEQYDFNVQNHGTIFILGPESQAAVRWCEEHVAQDGQRWGKNGYVVEHRYIAGIVKGLNTAGLKGHAL